MIFPHPIHLSRLRRIRAIALSLVLMPYAQAESVFSIEAAIQHALEYNPELQAAKHLIAEAEARSRMTGRLSNPEIETEIAGGRDFEGRVSVGLTQRFPLSSRLRLERARSATEIKIARTEIQNQERLLEIAVRSAAYELAFARAAIATARQQYELAERFAESLSEGVREGFGSALDGQQAELAAAMLKTRADLLALDETAAIGRLNGLMGRPLDAALSLTTHLDLPPEAPAQRPMAERADLHLAELMVQAGADDLSLAKASRWDDVGVGLFVEGERFRDEPEGIQSEALVGVRFSIPLPLWQDGSGGVAEKNAAQARRAGELAALHISARNDALIAHRMMAIRLRSAREMQDRLVPSARRQVEETQAAYLRGELTIENVFLSRERLLETESSALEAKKNYFIAHTEWLAAVGKTPAQP